MASLKPLIWALFAWDLGNWQDLDQAGTQHSPLQSHTVSKTNSQKELCKRFNLKGFFSNRAVGCIEKPFDYLCNSLQKKDSE